MEKTIFSFFKVLNQSIKQLGGHRKKLLVQPAFNKWLEEERDEKEVEAALLWGEQLLSQLKVSEWARMSLVLPGDNLFQLEELLFWVQTVVGKRFAYVEQLHIYLMRAQQVPSVVEEFMQYLEWDYGIVSELYHMEDEQAREQMTWEGMNLTMGPKVIIDLDGRAELSGVFFPEGSKYIDIFHTDCPVPHLTRL